MAPIKHISLLSTLAVSALAGFNPTAKSNIVIYWGQNSAGQQSTQTRLANYCAGMLSSFNGTMFPSPLTINFSESNVDVCIS